MLMNTHINSSHPQLADMRPITRLRSGKPRMPKPGFFIAGIILGWLLHSKASEAEIEDSWHRLLKNK